MEFEINTEPTEKDIAMADVPRMTLNPVSSSFDAELPAMKTRLDSALTMKLNSETESTAVEASQKIKAGSTHHHTAIITGITISLLFVASLAVVYVL